MRRFLPLVLLPALAFAADPIFARFDHAEHSKALGRNDVPCLTCHAVGADGKVPLEPPKSACHECHAPGEGGLGSGKPAHGAPRACATCHEVVPTPESHGAGWLMHHGTDATEGGATCQDCHARATCVDCHDRRENVTFKVHDPSWLSVHGIAVKADPASCDSCHVKQECTSCHASRAGFGRSP